MHKEAEFGVASHISYKENMYSSENRVGQGKNKKMTNPNLLWIGKILPSESSNDKTKNLLKTEDIPGWVKELVEYQKESGEEFIDTVKADFFEERIFVFTPKGDVIDLPKDSTVIDFAFNIHSDVGYHMSGAKVNGKFTSIETVLQNGDRIEIETKKSAKPSQKCLEHCKTTMAKRHIRGGLEGRKK
jgi:(p)ppGpp synthase/HD superfamily hydrolase